MVGLLLTLILWGAAADRYGERVVLCSGVGAAAVLRRLLRAGARDRCARRWAWRSPVPPGRRCIAASGRVVMGWFPPSRTRPGDGDAADVAAARRRTGRARPAAAWPARTACTWRAALPAALCLVAALLVCCWSPIRRARRGRRERRPPARPTGSRDVWCACTVQRAARRTAVRRRDVHPRLPRRPAALGRRRRRPDDRRLPGRRGGRPGGRRRLVRPRAQPARPDAPARGGQRGADGR